MAYPPMTTAEAITAIRTATRFDVASPSPVTDAMLLVWIESEGKRFRRELNAIAPALYSTVGTTQVLASPAQTLTKPANFEKLIRIERLFTDRWESLEPASETNQGFNGHLGFEEFGDTYLVWPLVSAPGSYRIIYSKTTTNGSISLEVPDGLEDVIVERVCGRVKERLQPVEAQIHFGIADRIWNEQKPFLRMRYGRANREGFRYTSRGY